ncbi:hypothetical protein NPIL_238931 [Nephila pilipes]|uniref:Uncharacterized protein n=1 Tax=Nephila pilipes TaxID=299642 RepID=A0A8X6USD7_NEPPI|nr:hypothetical protein NPIL_238931 [Nephila pilipes]
MEHNLRYPIRNTFATEAMLILSLMIHPQMDGTRQHRCRKLCPLSKSKRQQELRPVFDAAACSIIKWTLPSTYLPHDTGHGAAQAQQRSNCQRCQPNVTVLFSNRLSSEALADLGVTFVKGKIAQQILKIDLFIEYHGEKEYTDEDKKKEINELVTDLGLSEDAAEWLRSKLKKNLYHVGPYFRGTDIREKEFTYFFSKERD